MNSDDPIADAEMRRVLDEQDDRIARTSGTSRIVNAPATSEWRTVERHRAALRSAFESPGCAWVDGQQVGGPMVYVAKEIRTAADEAAAREWREANSIVRDEVLAAFDAAPALRDADWIMMRAGESWTRLVLDTCAVIAHACGWRTFAISEQDTWASAMKNAADAGAQYIGPPGTFLPNRP